MLNSFKCQKRVNIILECPAAVGGYDGVKALFSLGLPVCRTGLI